MDTTSIPREGIDNTAPMIQKFTPQNRLRKQRSSFHRQWNQNIELTSGWLLNSKDTLISLMDLWVCFAEAAPPARLAETGANQEEFLQLYKMDQEWVSENNLSDDTPHISPIITLTPPFNEHVCHENTGFLNSHAQKGGHLPSPSPYIQSAHSIQLTYLMISWPLILKYIQPQPFGEADSRNFLPSPCLVTCNKTLFLYHRTNISVWLLEHWAKESCLVTKLVIMKGLSVLSWTPACGSPPLACPGFCEGA